MAKKGARKLKRGGRVKKLRGPKKIAARAEIKKSPRQKKYSPPAEKNMGGGRKSGWRGKTVPGSVWF